MIRKLTKKTIDSFKRDLEAKFPDMFLLLSKIENEIKLDEIKKFLDVKRQELRGYGEPKNKSDYQTAVLTRAFEIYVRKGEGVSLKNFNQDFLVHSKEIVKDAMTPIHESIFHEEKIGLTGSN